MTEAVQITTLANGLRVISEHMPRLESASLGVWVDAGTRYEDADVNGVAHLLEHMAFKGTERRPAHAIGDEIERVGGSLNAHTSREHTAYIARILAGNVDLAADILADILRRSTFDPDELEMERHVVLQEIAMANDSPDDCIFDLMQETCFPDQPLGRHILGPEAIVATMPRDALVDYMARHYHPNRMVLAGAGRLEHARLVDLAERLFGDMPAMPAEAAIPARYATRHKIDFRPHLDQVRLCVAVEGLPHTHDDIFALQILSSMLGEGMSSRLFREVRMNRGLCYAISSFAWTYADTGLFGIYAGTSPDKVGELLQVTRDVTQQLVGEPTEAELERAKAQYKAGLIMGLEGCASVCEHLAMQLLYFGRYVSPAEMVAKIESVDTAAVRRVGANLLGVEEPNFVAVGPLIGYQPPVSWR